MRAPSPAPSSIASVSGSRRKREEEPKSAKKERVVSKKFSGDKKTSLKVTLKTGIDTPSPKDDNSPPSAGSNLPPIPSRTVDEGA